MQKKTKRSQHILFLMLSKTPTRKKPRNGDIKPKETPSVEFDSTFSKKNELRSSETTSRKQKLDIEAKTIAELESHKNCESSKGSHSSPPLVECRNENRETPLQNAKGTGTVNDCSGDDLLGSASKEYLPKPPVDSLPQLRVSTSASSTSTISDLGSEYILPRPLGTGKESNTRDKSAVKVVHINKGGTSGNISSTTFRSFHNVSPKKGSTKNNNNSVTLVMPSAEHAGVTRLKSRDGACKTPQSISDTFSTSASCSSREHQKEKSGEAIGNSVINQSLPLEAHSSSISLRPVEQPSNRTITDTSAESQGMKASSCTMGNSSSSFLVPSLPTTPPYSRYSTEEGAACHSKQVPSLEEIQTDGSAPPTFLTVSKMGSSSLGMLLAKDENSRSAHVEAFGSLDAAHRVSVDRSLQLAQKLVHGSSATATASSSTQLPTLDFLPSIERLPPGKTGAPFLCPGSGLSNSEGKSSSKSAPCANFGLLDSLPRKAAANTQDNGTPGKTQQTQFIKHDKASSNRLDSLLDLGHPTTPTSVVPGGDTSLSKDPSSLFLMRRAGIAFAKSSNFPLDENELIAAKSILPVICCPLANVGNSCYFNSVIQLLANCQAFVYVLRNSWFARSNRVCMDSLFRGSTTTTTSINNTSRDINSKEPSTPTLSMYSSSEEKKLGNIGAIEEEENLNEDKKYKYIAEEQGKGTSFSNSRSPTTVVSTPFFAYSLEKYSSPSPHPIRQQNSNNSVLHKEELPRSPDALLLAHQQLYAKVAQLLFLMQFGPDPVENSEGEAMLREVTESTLNTLGLVNQTFAGRSQQDAAEMISTVLGTLEEEGALKVDVSVLLESFREDYGKVERVLALPHHFIHQICQHSPLRLSKQSATFPPSRCHSSSMMESYAGCTSTLPRLGTLFSVVGNTTMVWGNSRLMLSSTKMAGAALGNSREKGVYHVDDLEEEKMLRGSNEIDGGAAEESKWRGFHDGDPEEAAYSPISRRFRTRSNCSSYAGSFSGNPLQRLSSGVSFISQDPRHSAVMSSFDHHHTQRFHSDASLDSHEHHLSGALGTEPYSTNIFMGEIQAAKEHCNYWGTNSLHWSKLFSFFEKINYDNQRLEAIVHKRQEYAKKTGAEGLVTGEMGVSFVSSVPIPTPTTGGANWGTCTSPCSSSAGAPPPYSPPKLLVHDVTNIFTGYTVSETTCHQCSNASRSVHAFQVLLLDIPSEGEWEALSKQSIDECDAPHGAWHWVGDGPYANSLRRRNGDEKGQRSKGGAATVDKISSGFSDPPASWLRQNSFGGSSHKSRSSRRDERRGSSQPAITHSLREVESTSPCDDSFSPDLDLDLNVSPIGATSSFGAPPPLRSYEAKCGSQAQHSRSLTAHSRTSSGAALLSSTSTVPKVSRPTWRTSLSGFLKFIKKKIYPSPSAPLTLWECMCHHFAPYVFTDQNLYKCEACGESSEATKREYIAHLPETLFIQMKRFEGGVFSNTKKKDEVDFPLSWDPFTDAQSFSLSVKDHILDLSAFVHPELRDTYRCFRDEEKQVPHSFPASHSDVFHSRGCSSAEMWGSLSPPSGVVDGANRSGITRTSSPAKKRESSSSDLSSPPKSLGLGEDTANAAVPCTPRVDGVERGEELESRGAPLKSSGEGSSSEGPSHLHHHTPPMYPNENSLKPPLLTSSSGAGTATHSRQGSTGFNSTTHVRDHSSSRSGMAVDRNSCFSSPSRPQLGVRAPHPVSTYSLVGVINHHGSLNSGHYTTYARKQKSNGKSIWVLINDDEVVPVDESEVAGAEEYILMYQQQPIVKRHHSIEEKLQQVARYLLQTMGKYSSFYFPEEEAQQIEIEAMKSHPPHSEDMGERVRKPTAGHPRTPSSFIYPEFSSRLPGYTGKERNFQLPLKGSTRVYISRSWLHGAAFLGDPGPIVNRPCYCSNAEKRRPLIPTSLLPPGTSPLTIKSLKENVNLPHVHMVPLEWFYVPVTLEDYLTFFNHYGGNIWVTVEELNEMVAQQQHFKAQLAGLLQGQEVLK